MTPDWAWNSLHTPWEKMGEVFLTVSPGLVFAWVSNAEAIHQITSQREAFPKELGSYKILDLFGRNVVTTEGFEWKQHRKISSRNFTEANNELVFAESCSQTQGMLLKWAGPDGKGNITIEDVPMDTMRLTLHIISSIGFGIKLLWPGEQPKGTESEVYSSHEPPPGHSMSFESALNTLLEQLLWVLLTPKWLLRHLPIDACRKASESFENWTQYMDELFTQKKIDARKGQHGEGIDILGSLVSSAYGPDSDQHKPIPNSSPGKAEKGSAELPLLSDSDILGNAFVMIIAGHETTANSAHFSLIELAMNGKAQREVQKEVQSIFGDAAPESWNYSANINKLLGGMVGAVLNEQLRLMPPVVAIPKSVAKNTEQVISIDGKKIIMTGGMMIGLCVIEVQRKTRYWPTRPSTVTDRPDDLDDFKPERWLIKSGADVKRQPDNTPTQSDDEESFGGFTGDTSHATLFRPVRGSYIPFSDGARSCLGRRLAQVEIMAVLAVIFQRYSVELAVDEWASDEEVAAMSVEEKIAVYGKAQEKARRIMRTASSLITLKLHSGFIPVRLVTKGEERFVNHVA